MARVIECDTRQKTDKHKAKHEYFEAHGYTLVRTKLYAGDYRFVGGTICVDTKQNIAEIAQNITVSHDRFKRECINAQAAGYTLFILVENTYGVTDLKTLKTWLEPEEDFMKRRKAKARLNGETLAKAMYTIQERYGVVFDFCHPRDAGEKVLDILTGGEHIE